MRALDGRRRPGGGLSIRRSRIECRRRWPVRLLAYLIAQLGELFGGEPLAGCRLLPLDFLALFGTVRRDRSTQLARPHFTRRARRGRLGP